MTFTDALSAVDYEGILHDVRQMGIEVWRRNNYSLSGAAFEFKEEAESFLAYLIHVVFCPDLWRFRVELNSHSYRCENCNRMQNGGSPMVWISDGTMMGDPLWAILEENCSGSSSGWCVPCVRKLVKEAE